MPDQAVIIVDVPPIAPTAPGEGQERPVSPFVYADPEQRFGEPNWRTEPTSELDPRKGR